MASTHRASARPLAHRGSRGRPPHTLSGGHLPVASRGLLTLVLLASGLAGADAGAAEHPQIIQLTQTGCQFLEPEGTDHGYKTTKKADCEAINAQTGADRIAKSKVIELKPGRYVFRVTNKNVPYDLGFWLRSKGYNFGNPLHKLTKTSVSGGGLSPGKTQDYAVTLEPGEYVFSCPLNTTPDYRLVVKGG